VRQILPTNAEDRDFFVSKVCLGVTDGFRGIKIIEGDEVLGMVGYDDWTVTGVTMHIYVKDTRALSGGKFIEEAFRFPFSNGRKVVVGTIPSDNLASIKFAEWLGFDETYRIRDGYDDGIDMIILEMRKENCRFLGEVH
jgi:RimJ/RimL family protein N-acetyltransferase